MIYPDVTLEEWLKRYPDLESSDEECPECGTFRTVNIPFLSKKWIGLMSSQCKCGCPPIVCQIPKDAETFEWTSNLYNGLVNKYNRGIKL